MARFLALIHHTDEGRKQLHHTTARARSFAAAAIQSGIAVESQYWTTGAQDGFILLNGPEQSVLHALAKLSQQGNVRIEVSRAYDAAEFDHILGH